MYLIWLRNARHRRVSAVLFGTLLVALLGAGRAFAETKSLRLSWIQIPNAVAYEIEISSAGRESGALVERKIEIPEVTVELPPGVYQYRVRAYEAGIPEPGPWSDMMPIEIDAGPIGSLLPADKSELKIFAGPTSSLNLTWRGDAGAKFQIEVRLPSGESEKFEAAIPALVFRPRNSGDYRWRVGYSHFKKPNFSPWQTFKVGLIKPEKTKAKFSLWAGSYASQFAGSYPALSNSAKATTVSGSLRAVQGWSKKNLARNAENRGAIDGQLNYHTLVKESRVLTGIGATGARFWQAGAVSKIGVLLRLAYVQKGLYSVDAFQKYEFESVWRNEWQAGLAAELPFIGKSVATPFALAGASTGGNSRVLGGALKMSPVIEAGLSVRFSPSSRWRLRTKYVSESFQTAGANGTAKLKVDSVGIEMGLDL